METQPERLIRTGHTFDEIVNAYLQCVPRLLRESLTANYRYLPLDEYEELMRADPKTAVRVYWQEIMFLAHSGAALSVVRAYGWLEGFKTAAETAQLYAFAACMRGFLESAADTYHALGGAAGALAKNHRLIKRNLEGDLSEGYATSRSLENHLLHFANARRLRGAELLEVEIHRAKTAKEYLTVLDEAGIPKLEQLYAELCEVCHPSQASIALYFEARARGDCGLNVSRSGEWIASFLERYRDTLPLLLQIGFNTGAAILRVLLDFPFPELWCESARKWLKGGWGDLDSALCA